MKFHRRGEVKKMGAKTLDRFGERAKQILRDAALIPHNPMDYFGRSIRRGWAYAYFDRLFRAGYLELVDPPPGRKGHHWYRTTDKAKWIELHDPDLNKE